MSEWLTEGTGGAFGGGNNGSMVIHIIFKIYAHGPRAVTDVREEYQGINKQNNIVVPYYDNTFCKFVFHFPVASRCSPSERRTAVVFTSAFRSQRKGIFGICSRDYETLHGRKLWLAEAYRLSVK